MASSPSLPMPRIWQGHHVNKPESQDGENNLTLLQGWGKRVLQTVCYWVKGLAVAFSVFPWRIWRKTESKLHEFLETFLLKKKFFFLVHISIYAESFSGFKLPQILSFLLFCTHCWSIEAQESVKEKGTASGFYPRAYLVKSMWVTECHIKFYEYVNDLIQKIV